MHSARQSSSRMMIIDPTVQELHRFPLGANPIHAVVVEAQDDFELDPYCVTNLCDAQGRINHSGGLMPT